MESKEIKTGEVNGFAVNVGTSELTIDESVYKISDFRRIGFTLTLSETKAHANGDTVVFTEELLFTT